MNNPLISIIIPVYNVRAYLRQCLDSVIHQTYQNLEILIIDDGSSDGSARICDEYAREDSRIRVFHTENRGLASARNLGLDHITGDLISFLDSDDWMELYAIETLLSTMRQTNADIVVAQKCYEYHSETIFPAKASESFQIYKGQDILPAFTQGLFSDSVWNKLYTAECFASLRFPDGHNYEDVATTWKLMMNLAKTEGVITLNLKALFHFRMRKSSITHTKTLDNIVDRWEAYYAKLEALPEYEAQLLPACITSAGQVWFHYYDFSSDEKKRANHVLQQIQLFSKVHFDLVMSGNYTFYIRLFCLLSKYRYPVLIWFCYYANKLRNLISNDRKRPLYK